MSFVHVKRDRFLSYSFIALALLVSTSGPAAVAQIRDGESVTGTGVGSDFELVFWQSVSGSDDRGQFEAYLARYPSGTFAALAKAKITTLDRREATTIRPRPADPVVAPIMPVPLPNASVPNIPPVVMPVATVGPATQPAPLPAPVPKPLTGPQIPSEPPQAVGEPSLAQQLRALGQSQGRRPTPGVQLPARPVLTRISPPSLPTQFCSAVLRNEFYDTRFKPAIDHASSNNAAAIAHLQVLQNLFQNARDSGDVTTANLYAAEAQDYGPVTKEIYADRTLFDPVFNQIMAIPIVDCAGGK